MNYRLRAALVAASLSGAAALSGCATQSSPQWEELCEPGAITAEVAEDLRRLGTYEAALRYLGRSCPEAALALSDIPTEFDLGRLGGQRVGGRRR